METIDWLSSLGVISKEETFNLAEEVKKKDNKKEVGFAQTGKNSED